MICKNKEVAKDQNSHSDKKFSGRTNLSQRKPPFTSPKQ